MKAPHVHSARRSSRVVACLVAWGIGLCLAASLRADGGASWPAGAPRLELEVPWPNGPAHRPLDFDATGWNVLPDLDRTCSASHTFVPVWNPTFSNLLRNVSDDPLTDGAVYRLEEANTEVLWVDLRSQEDFVRLARVRGNIRDTTSFSAELFRRSEQVDFGTPLRSAKLNIATQVGKVQLYGEFLSSNWNSLEGPLGSGSSATGSSALTLRPPVQGDLGGPSLALRKPPTGDAVTIELGATIPLTPESESRLSYQRNTERFSAAEELTERVGIEGALQLQEGVKLRAGYERTFSYQAGAGAGKTEDSSIWTGIVINF